ncbi:hypothetical protein D3C72_2090830 [compost metagenome]
MSMSSLRTRRIQRFLASLDGIQRWWKPRMYPICPSKSSTKKPVSSGGKSAAPMSPLKRILACGS